MEMVKKRSLWWSLVLGLAEGMCSQIIRQGEKRGLAGFWRDLNGWALHTAEVAKTCTHSRFLGPGCVSVKKKGWGGRGDEHQTKIKLSLHLHLHWQSSKLAGQFAVLKFCTLRGNATGCFVLLCFDWNMACFETIGQREIGGNVLKRLQWDVREVVHVMVHVKYCKGARLFVWKMQKRIKLHIREKFHHHMIW